jgi:hypothetical protein
MKKASLFCLMTKVWFEESACLVYPPANKYLLNHCASCPPLGTIWNIMKSTCCTLSGQWFRGLLGTTLHGLFLRASSAVLSTCPLSCIVKYFSHPSLVIYFFTKLKLVQQIGRGVLTANHLDQSLWWANQKHRTAVRSYLLHPFL